MYPGLNRNPGLIHGFPNWAKWYGRCRGARWPPGWFWSLSGAARVLLQGMSSSPIQSTPQSVGNMLLAKSGLVPGPLGETSMEPEGVFVPDVAGSLPLPRGFGIQQGPKVRRVDDFSRSSVNSTMQSCESPKPHTLDVFAGMCLGHV